MDVLVVEDNPIVQSGIARALEHATFRVTAVGDAISAFSELERRVFDVIVCDVQLPFIDGMEFYTQLAEKHPSMSHRVMFVTAMVDDPIVRAFIDRTGRPALGKPFELAELVANVTRLAQQAELSEQPVIGIQRAEREIARQLPDELLGTSGGPLERVAQLVDRHWSGVAESDRRQLAQMLIVVLEPVLLGGTVTRELRQRCEDAVMGWAARQ